MAANLETGISLTGEGKRKYTKDDLSAAVLLLYSSANDNTMRKNITGHHIKRPEKGRHGQDK